MGVRDRVPISRGSSQACSFSSQGHTTRGGFLPSLGGTSLLKDSVSWWVVIPHYVYSLRERKLAFLKPSSGPSNMPGLPYMSSRFIPNHRFSLTSQSARSTSWAPCLLQIQVHSNQNLQCSVLWQVPDEKGWRLKPSPWPLALQNDLLPGSCSAKGHSHFQEKVRYTQKADKERGED